MHPGEYRLDKGALRQLGARISCQRKSSLVPWRVLEHGATGCAPSRTIIIQKHHDVSNIALRGRYVTSNIRRTAHHMVAFEHEWQEQPLTCVHSTIHVVKARPSDLHQRQPRWRRLTVLLTCASDDSTCMEPGCTVTAGQCIVLKRYMQRSCSDFPLSPLIGLIPFCNNRLGGLKARRCDLVVAHVRLSKQDYQC